MGAMIRMVFGFALLAGATAAQAFCGFYVGKADASLFNQASQVILTRDGNRTVLSMANDYQGELTEFAMVVPVPTVLQRDQIHIGDPQIFSRLDAYSAPRLAEYFDENPCAPPVLYERSMMASPAMADAPMTKARTRSLGVTVEAQYTVGEYDIVILSAKQSDGLETWLRSSGYRIPAGAARALKPYIKQGLKFFVAKVNLKAQAKTGFTKLRPLQFAFEDARFMLPIRLGMLNANGPQDLIVYVLSRQGRVESSNYRTIALPANVDLPVHIRGDFQSFYKALFEEQAKKEDYRAVFTEYFWDMSWCDPCAADPLSPDELRQAGVWWLDGEEMAASTKPTRGIQPRVPSNKRAPPRMMPPSGGGQQAMLTRLHIRYTADTFPEDLSFVQTEDRQNFQTRYVLRHPWTGEASCPAAQSYRQEVIQRQESEAQTLATLTGWDIGGIRAKIQTPKITTAITTATATPSPQASPTPPPKKRRWWHRLWRDSDTP